MGKNLNINTTNEENWLTPPALIKSLGTFDLDPCSPIVRPWDTAKHHYTIDDNGLLMPWFGRVWCNPPYGKYMGQFLHKMALHNDGIALIFARTDTVAFQEYIFPHAESIFFMRGRITFHNLDGTPASGNGGAPSVLISYGESNSDAIDSSGLRGHHVSLKPKVFIAGIALDSNKTWRVIVGECLEELDKEATLSDIYETVLKLAPEKVRKNQNYKAKIRQTCQLHFDRISKATYKLN